jgi:hypothetical protein
MQRPAFVGSTVPAFLGAALAPDLLRAASTPPNASTRVPPTGSFVLRANEGRTPAPLNVVGETGRAKVRGADSGGQLCFFDFLAPPKSGPPLHRHSREDELFYMLEGELVSQLPPGMASRHRRVAFGAPAPVSAWRSTA